ncbi:MAG TPA: hypothetical protein VHC20_00435 [Candidatus Paceibacterota bacterium]|nr:hypothetical protein [Candidatus Paceibacterota bacterium]
MPASQPAQAFVPVKEVRSGTIILKEGGYRGILMCSSVNFALKSDDEQKGIIGGFQNFLNTLDFSVEIVVHSRKMDIRPYLELLRAREDKQQTDLMRIQIREYEQFVRGFAEQANIMTKTFYVVVPYTPAVVTAVKSAIPFLNRGPATQTNTSDDFEEHRIQLEQRMSLVAGGLAQSGVRAAALGTEEIIELLYRSFNLGELENPIRLSRT